jgi:hypothetical protein
LVTAVSNLIFPGQQELEQLRQQVQQCRAEFCYPRPRNVNDAECIEHLKVYEVSTLETGDLRVTLDFDAFTFDTLMRQRINVKSTRNPEC